MNSESGGIAPRFDPSDEQIQQSPLVYIRTDFDVRSLEQKQWAEFADYGGTPVPAMIRKTLLDSFFESAGTRLPENLVSVVTEDRPPRASPLFPAFFVDLIPIYDYLRATVSDEVVGAIVAKALSLTAGKLRLWFASKGLPESAMRDQFSGATLEALCENYVRTSSPSIGALTIFRDLFNTKLESGYWFAADPNKPMGWHIIIRSSECTFDFMVDKDADVIQLEIEEAGVRRAVSGVSIRDPGFR